MILRASWKWATRRLHALGTKGLANILAALALLLASGQFTHAHELRTAPSSYGQAHIHLADASSPTQDHAVLLSADEESETLHCGAPALGAGFAGWPIPTRHSGVLPIAHSVRPPSKPACYEPPPPRT